MSKSLNNFALKPGRRLVQTVLLTGLVCAVQAQQKDYAAYVNPFVGTGGHGHTFPGATMPFGLVQLSPDTGVEGWDWCSGYHYSDSSIMGFSHTHLSGTGGADYGDILLMPGVGNLNFLPGTKANPDLGYRSRFSHLQEEASPGYYSVYLEDYGIRAELTATVRTGMHQYTFPKSNESYILLDLNHGISDVSTDAGMTILGHTRIEGYRFSQGWAADQRVYFALEFSKPFRSSEIRKNDSDQVDGTEARAANLKAAFLFDTQHHEAVVVKVALSSVSCANAWENMAAENPGFDFNLVKHSARAAWNVELAKIEVETDIEADKIIFYTSMYHTKIHPNTFQDVNGEYRGMDMKVHRATDRTHYTLYSLWDTFRALHPLYSLTDTRYNNDFVLAMMAKYRESGRLPVWELWSNETNTMIGYHSIPVMADAILKGYYTGDTEQAYEAMKASAMADGQGLRDYRHLHYIPREKEANSVSKTVEYAFDDYAIAQVAKLLGKHDDYRAFIRRAGNYRNLFDPQTKFMRGRDENGVWNPDFDPMAISLFGSGDFTEGNSWHYSFFAPHDMSGLMELYGGADAFAVKLDEMFEQEAVNDNEHAHDVTGLIGQYAQGNEPSHHVIYTYNFAGRPYRTQELIRRVMRELYSDQPDGYSGNEDTGQMSAWYIFSSMGFYPMNPVGGEYIIGSPLFRRTTIHLENGRRFVIEAQGDVASMPYIASATLNGKSYRHTSLSHSDLMQGGELVFQMSTVPTSWGTAPTDRPVQRATSEVLPELTPRVFMPYPKSAVRVFGQPHTLELVCETPGVEIYYTLDGTTPSTRSKRYAEPLVLKNSVQLQAIGVKEGFLNSDVKVIDFRKAYFNNGTQAYPTISSDTRLGRSYNPGIQTLIDGVLGSNNFLDGRWTGIQNDNLRATIDLGAVGKVSRVTLNFTQNTGSWIFPPKAIHIWGSVDGKNFKPLASEQYEPLDKHPEIVVITQSLSLKAKVRYLKIEVENYGPLPSWHSGAGKSAYIFIDEITIE